MSETELHVEFDQPQEVFFPGAAISGRVLLNTEKIYKARAVNIQFEGRAFTDWDEHESVRRTGADGKTTYASHRVNYSATIKYLEHEMLLWASRDGSNELQPGAYCWPFSYLIPSTVPPSFEGKYGSVRYTVKAEVDRPWRFDKAKKLCISVSPLLDLNIIPHALAPLHDRDSENIGCCCFKKGHLELRVDIPKGGFVPGEVVPLNLHILNHGSVPVTEMKAKIVQRTSFTAYRNGYTTMFSGDLLFINGSSKKEKHEQKTVIKMGQPINVEPGKEFRMVAELRLPSVTPTINQFCPIITVEYFAEVSIDTSATFNSEVECELPVLIGTVPIRQFLPPSYYPTNPSLPNVPTPLPPQFGGVPPPSYGFLPQNPEHPENSVPYPMAPGAPSPYPTDPNPPYPSAPESAPTDPSTVVIPSAPPLQYEDSMYGTEGTDFKTDENEKPFAPKYPVFNDLPVYNPTAPPKE